MSLGKLEASIKTGGERIHELGVPVGPERLSLLDFWRWGMSDVLGNTSRGILAEWLVSMALGLPKDQPRDEWAVWDITTPEGIKVEVKSAGFVQSWYQQKLSDIKFSIKRTLAWDPKTGKLGKEKSRWADVYVFALHAHKDKDTIDPLDLSQWEFFVVPTLMLNARKGSQEFIGLAALQREFGPEIPYHKIHAAVIRAVDPKIVNLEGNPTNKLMGNSVGGASV